MKEQTCDTCHITMPIKKFLNKKRRPEATCTECRAKQRRKLRYKAQAMSSLQAKVRAERMKARAVNKSRLENDLAYVMLKEVRLLMSKHKSKIRVYEQRVEAGTDTPRTHTGLAAQRAKVNYYEDVMRIISRDAQAGRVEPLTHYLTNTRLRAKHGFAWEIDPNDPDLEENLNNA